MLSWLVYNRALASILGQSDPGLRTRILIPWVLLQQWCTSAILRYHSSNIVRLFFSGVSSEKPPLMAKPKDAASQLHFTLPNGRVPAGSVALPGIHSVAAARAALASTNGVSVGVNSSMPAGRAFNFRSNHLTNPASGADAVTASPVFQLPPFPDSGHPFYGLPSSFHKSKDRPSNFAPSTTATTTTSSAAAATSSATAATTAPTTSSSTAKQGKSGGSKHWLSCYHSSNSQTPTPSPSDKEEDSPTDHGFKTVPAAAALERPTSLAVRGFEAVWQSGGESQKEPAPVFFRLLDLFFSSREESTRI